MPNLLSELNDIRRRAGLPIKENIFQGWSGGWITDGGDVIDVDQSKGYHHADAAMDEFSEYVQPNDSGEHDKYSYDIAVGMAFDDGWLTFSTVAPQKEISVTWSYTVEPRALRGLFEIIKENPEYGLYMFSVPD